MGLRVEERETGKEKKKGEVLQSGKQGFPTFCDSLVAIVYLRYNHVVIAR